nr:M17 family peptidase N-terminal domain-containing protein [Tepidiforma sp.]
MPAPRVLVAGLGDRSEFDIDAVRNLSANVVRALRRPGIRRVATIAHGAGIAGLDAEACAQAIAEGSILGNYRFVKHKSNPGDERAEIEELVIVEFDPVKLAPMERAVERGSILAEATNIARDWANEPSNHLTPTMLAERAAALARDAGLEIEVLEREDMERKGMGSLLSVARGSAEPPKLIRLGYRGRGGEGWDLALVGKGITFDTGGISIKPAANMEAMKADMTGAANVLAAAWALAKLGAKLNVLAIAPCTENMPSGTATKPGDVVRAMNGRTIEVINTDAEGRLVLADAICWANELGAKRIVDVATLTGAVTTALGDVCYALMTNDDALCAGGGGSGGGGRREDVAAADVEGVRRVHQERRGGLPERRGGEPGRGDDRRREVPRAVRWQDAVGAHGHRGRRQHALRPRLGDEGRERLQRPGDDQPRAGAGRRLTDPGLRRGPGAPGAAPRRGPARPAAPPGRAGR